jgi:Zn-dependent protease/CBS domain-containing protein
MKWSWKVGTLAGIDFRIHFTFLLLLIWVAVSHWSRTHSSEAALNGVLFIVALFACVVLHELGHALTARKYGIPTTDITLLPIGGVARLERMPDDPYEELWVALAGPAVNVAIAAVLYLTLRFSHIWMPIEQLHVTVGPFLERLLVANIVLVLFNLIPAFPMDGGRVLRALLATRLPYARATRIAASVGQALAVVFGFLGFFFNPMLMFIALFVWIGASQESSQTQAKSVISEVPIHAAMLSDFRTLKSGDTLADAARAILEGSQHDFPVMEEGRVIGILTRSDMLVALATHGRDYPVTSAMRQDFFAADISEPLEIAFERIQSKDCQTMPILRDGRLVGLITAENLAEYLLIQSAIRKSNAQSEARGLKNRAAAAL